MLPTRIVADDELDDAVARWRADGWALLPAVAASAACAALRDRADAIVAGRVDIADLFFQPDAATGRYEDTVRAHGWDGPERAYRKIEKLERDPVFRVWLENPV